MIRIKPSASETGGIVKLATQDFGTFAKEGGETSSGTFTADHKTYMCKKKII